ncbi:hypothetical protein AAE478_005031 [Parahypoxylon ruwenzoriense]
MASQESSKSPLLSEKQSGVPQPAPPLPQRRSSWSWVRLSAVFLTIIAGIGLLRHTHYAYPKLDSSDQSSSQTPEGWTEWSSITPSEKLTWKPCFAVFGADFQCARLTVPMDYNRPLNESADNPKVHLALVMKPGSHRIYSPSAYSESPLLLNPGGPGGSGAVFALALGPLLHTVVGSHRDIIGFDPRGVGATTPKADCFAVPDGLFEVDGRNVAFMNRASWATSGHDIGLVNSSNVALSKHDVRSRALGKLCKRVDEAEGDNSIFRYSNTPNVARDMLSIIHAWDEWRSVPDAKPAKSMRGSEADGKLQTGTKIAASDSTQGKLVYWGFSYGSLLGATFASMFPDKVGRVILDGVVDADHYVGAVMADNILDADAVWEKFFVYCAEAGPGCQFSNFGDRPEDIKERFNDLMGRLEKEPAIVLPRGANVPVLVTASDFKLIIFSALYSPIVVFPTLALLLRALANGELDLFTLTPVPAMLCRNLTLPLWPDDAQKLNEDITGLQKRFEQMATYSSFADIWMNIGFNLACNGWEIEAKDPPMRWDDHPAHKAAPIETSFPLLFLSNTLDPVTPLRAALKMAHKFVNASVVEQRAEGHCTISCVSPCTIGHVRAYLDGGVLPPPSSPLSSNSDGRATCECSERPFKSLEDATLGDDILRGKTAEEAETMMAYRDLRSRFVDFTAFQQHFEYDNPLRHAVRSDSVFAARERHTCKKSP